MNPFDVWWEMDAITERQLIEQAQGDLFSQWPLMGLFILGISWLVYLVRMSDKRR